MLLSPRWDTSLPGERDKCIDFFSRGFIIKFVHVRINIMIGTPFTLYNIYVAI